MTPLERVARAIARAHWGRTDPFVGDILDIVVDSTWQNFEEETRAAIEAIPLNDGLAALFTAEKTQLTKLPDERDTEFVKRIVRTYFAALEQGT